MDLETLDRRKRNPELAAGGASLLGGTSLMRSGMKDLDFSNSRQNIFDDAKRRLKIFSTIASPTDTRTAHNLYKDLADTFEQTSRSTDDLITRYPTILKMTGGKFGIEKDVIRQGLSKSLLAQLKPNADLNHPALMDAGNDVINRVRGAGFLDYDQGQHILRNFKNLKNEAQRGIEVAEHATPHIRKITRLIGNLGKLKTGIGAAATIGGGAWLHNTLGRTKEASYSSVEKDLSAVTSPLSAFAIASGAKDIINTPKDILVSYGSDDRLGAGHASPGKNIASIIKEDPRFKKYNVDAVLAPSTQGLVSTTNPDALNRKYALGVDTGWGILDDVYEKNWGARDFPTGGSLYRDAVIRGQGPLGGQTINTGDDILSSVNRVLKFHPDAPSIVSGNDYKHLTNNKEYKGLIGAFKRLFTNTGKYYNTTYGDSSRYGGSNLSFVGAAHPAANIDASAALDEVNYRKLVAEELAKHNPGSNAEDWIKRIGNRKIISISGASRGDSVGARIAAINEAMGKNRDDYFLLGMGGKNKEAQRAIAMAAELNPNNIGFTGFTPKFTSLAQGSDLHFMGMGGSTPYEMMSYAGKAPIIRASDEEIFEKLFTGKDKSEEGIKNWLNDWDRTGEKINKSKGLAAKQIALANKVLASGKITDPLVLEALREAADYKSDRFWMNPTNLVDESGNIIAHSGSHPKLKRGLDGILDYMDSKGVKSVTFGDDGTSLAALLKDFREGKLSGLSNAARQTVRSDIAASKAGLADELFKHWKSSRNTTRLKGLGKAGLGLAALYPLLAGVFNRNNNKELAKGINDKQPTPNFFKRSSEYDTGDLVTSGLMTGIGGNLVHNGINAQIASSEMDSLRNKLYTKNYWDPQEAANLMNEYAEKGQKLLNTNPLIVPSKAIGRALPLSEWYTLITRPGVSAARFSEDVIGSRKLTDFITRLSQNYDTENNKFLDKLKSVRDAADHYSNFSKTPHEILKTELKGSSDWLNLSPESSKHVFSQKKIGDSLLALDQLGKAENIDDVARFTAGDNFREATRWQVGKFAENFLNKGRGPYAYGPINRNLGRVGAIGGTALAAIGASKLFNIINDQQKTNELQQTEITLNNNNLVPSNNQPITNINPNLKKGLIGAGALVGTGLLSTYIYKKLKDKKKRDAEKAIYNPNYPD